jgi:histidine decarboxylase
VYVLHAIHALESALPELIADCVRNADHLVGALVSRDVHAWRNPFAITVVFPAPSDRLIRRWSLPTQDGQAHVITVPSVTRSKLDQFVNEYVAECAPNAPTRADQ